MSTSNTISKIGAVFYIIWACLHLLAAYSVYVLARLSANVSGYPNVTGNKLVLDAHCLADCKGLGSKRKSAGSQRTRQWELSIDQRLEFLQRCDPLLYKQCGYRGQVALEIGCADVMSRRHALYGMA